MCFFYNCPYPFLKVSELHQIYEAKKEGCELLYRYKRAKRAVNYDLAGAGSGHMDCCPLVIDPLTLTALLAFIAAATYFLWGWNMTLLTFGKYSKILLEYLFIFIKCVKCIISSKLFKRKV